MIKKGQKVWKIEINFPTESKKYQLYKKGVHIDELEVLGVSEHKIVLNNDWFTVLDVQDGKKQSYHTYLDDVKVDIRVKDTLFENGIFIRCNSTKKPTKQLLDKFVAIACVKVEKDYGFLLNGISNEMYSLVDSFTF
jgi:hypothetical protein